jgi:hypothetical protein
MSHKLNFVQINRLGESEELVGVVDSICVQVGKQVGNTGLIQIFQLKGRLMIDVRYPKDQEIEFIPVDKAYKKIVGPVEVRVQRDQTVEVDPEKWVRVGKDQFYTLIEIVARDINLMSFPSKLDNNSIALWVNDVPDATLQAKYFMIVHYKRSDGKANPRYFYNADVVTGPEK